MFCTKCGAKLDDGAKFCSKCGSSAGGTVTPVRQVFEASNQPEENLPVAQWVRKLARSPLFIIAVIAFTWVLISTINNAKESNILYTIYEVADTFGIESEIRYLLSDIAPTINGISGFVTAFSILPSVAIAVGLWMLLISAFNPDKTAFSGKGLIPIRIVYKVELVLTWIPFILVEISLIASFISNIGVLIEYSKYRDMGSVILTTIIVSIVSILVVGLSYMIKIQFYSGIVRTTNTAYSVIEYNNVRYDISAYAAIYLIVVGILKFVVVGSISGISFVSVCDSTSFVLFGCVMLIFRNKMLSMMKQQYSAYSSCLSGYTISQKETHTM